MFNLHMNQKTEKKIESGEHERSNESMLQGFHYEIIILSCI